MSASALCLSSPIAIGIALVYHGVLTWRHFWILLDVNPPTDVSFSERKRAKCMPLLFKGKSYCVMWLYFLFIRLYTGFGWVPRKFTAQFGIIIFEVLFTFACHNQYSKSYNLLIINQRLIKLWCESHSTRIIIYTRY